MASFFRSALMAGTRSIAAKSTNSNVISSQFSSSASGNLSQASGLLAALGRTESMTPLHRLNSPPRVKSKGFIVRTTPKISVVVRSLDRQNPNEEGPIKAVSCGRTSTPAKMTIALRSYDRLVFEDKFEGKRVRLPETRKLITVNRSPHVDKKSREQFEIRVRKQLVILQTTEKDEWKRKLFWMKNGRQFLS